MRERRKDLKLKARRALTGHYPAAAGAMAVAGVISVLLVIMCQICVVFSAVLSLSAGNREKSVLAAAVVLGFGLLAFFLFHFLLIPGMLKLCLNICRGEEAGVWDLFWGFHNRGGRFLGIGLVFILLAIVLMTPEIILYVASDAARDWRFAGTFLPWYSLLVTGAGIYVSLTYGQFYMILADDPEKSLLQALAESEEMMRGSRWRLLALWFSFLGWIPIASITLGLALLWLVPYMICTHVFFYLGVKKNMRRNQE